MRERVQVPPDTGSYAPGSGDNGADKVSRTGGGTPTIVLLFDPGGTIIDTHAVHLASWLGLLRPRRIDVDMDLYREKFSSGASTAEITDDLLPDFSRKEKEEMVRGEEGGYRGRLAQSSGALSPARETLSRRPGAAG